ETERIIEKTELLKKGLMQKLLTKGIGHTKFKNTELGEIPEEWKITKLGDYSEKIQYGYTQSSSQEPIGPKFLRITDIKNNSVNWNKVPYCSCSDKDYEKYKIRENDIVFARTGATTGKSYLITKPPKTVFASYLIKVRVNIKLNPNFVYYFFQTQKYWNQIKVNISGSTQGGVNATKLSNLKIPLPPLPEQEKIASILSKVDTQLQDNHNYLNKLEELKKGLMQDLLTGKVRVCV
ncbi:MAG: restriction endonuclease subunit S, partial [Methanosarcinaceae archaeon]|nr:restriction endonuclease subunit S [Methanosarcinaceae archaeon]